MVLDPEHKHVMKNSLPPKHIHIMMNTLPLKLRISRKFTEPVLVVLSVFSRILECPVLKTPAKIPIVLFRPPSCPFLSLLVFVAREATDLSRLQSSSHDMEAAIMPPVKKPSKAAIEPSSQSRRQAVNAAVEPLSHEGHLVSCCCCHLSL